MNGKLYTCNDNNNNYCVYSLLFFKHGVKSNVFSSCDIIYTNDLFYF